MAAYFESGFSVREPMWHGLGLVTDEYPESWAQAREWAGLQWEPRKVPVYRKEVALSEDGVSEQYVEVESHALVERDDTGAPLGVVTSGYELVTHSKMGEIIEALCDESDHVKYETAGAVRGGAQVYATIRVDEAYSLGGNDDTDTLPYLVLTNAHDGTGACRAQMVDIRVVCWNTYRLAEAQGDKHGRTFVFRHTTSVNDRIDEAKAALRGVREESLRWRKIAEKLAGMHVDDEQVRDFLSLFIAMPPTGVVSDRVRENVERDRAAWTALYERSVTTDGHRGSALGLIDASVEYLDHLRKYQNRETYLGRTLLRTEPLKAGAFGHVAEVLGVDRRELVEV